MPTHIPRKHLAPVAQPGKTATPAQPDLQGLIDKLSPLALTGPTPGDTLRRRDASAQYLPRKVSADTMSTAQRTVLKRELRKIKSQESLAIVKHLETPAGKPKLKEPSLIVSYDENGHLRRRVKSNTLAAGASGAFALVVDEQGALGGVKVFRGPERRRLDADKLAQKRHDLRRAGMYDEADALELKTKEVSFAEFKSEYEVLKHVDSRLKLRDQVKLNGRLLAFTDVMQNEVLQLAGAALSRPARRDVTRSLFLQGSASLAAVHAKNVLHRDVKLENMLYDANGKFELADFGFGVHGDLNGKATGSVGTPTYVAPEVLSRRPYGPGVDTYSFGVTVAMSGMGQAFVEDGLPQAAAFWQCYKTFPRLADGTIDMTALIPRLANGAVDAGAMTHLSQDDLDFREFFSIWHNTDPKLASFVLNRMLNPEPRKRATMAQCHAFAEALLKTDPDCLSRAAKVTQSFADNDPRNDKEAILRAYSKAFFSPPA